MSPSKAEDPEVQLSQPSTLFDTPRPNADMMPTRTASRRCAPARCQRLLWREAGAEGRLDRIYEDLVTAFIGPSGCGKSTLLRCLNRMNDLIHGNGQIEPARSAQGHDVNARDGRRSSCHPRVGMVFQKSNPFPSRSTRTSLRSGLA